MEQHIVDRLVKDREDADVKSSEEMRPMAKSSDEHQEISSLINTLAYMSQKEKVRLGKAGLAWRMAMRSAEDNGEEGAPHKQPEYKMYEQGLAEFGEALFTHALSAIAELEDQEKVKSRALKSRAEQGTAEIVEKKNKRSMRRRTRRRSDERILRT